MSFSICCTYIVYSRTQRERRFNRQKSLNDLIEGTSCGSDYNVLRDHS